MNISLDITKLQQVRLVKGYSQRELSKAAGISTIVVNSMERSQSIPRPSTLKKYVMFLM